jgi:hypothetical protein
MLVVGQPAEAPTGALEDVIGELQQVAGAVHARDRTAAAGPTGVTSGPPGSTRDASAAGDWPPSMIG